MATAIPMSVSVLDGQFHSGAEELVVDTVRVNALRSQSANHRRQERPGTAKVEVRIRDRCM